MAWNSHVIPYQAFKILSHRSIIWQVFLLCNLLINLRNNRVPAHLKSSNIISIHEKNYWITRNRYQTHWMVSWIMLCLYPFYYDSWIILNTLHGTFSCWNSNSYWYVDECCGEPLLKHTLKNAPINNLDLYFFRLVKDVLSISMILYHNLEASKHVQTTLACYTVSCLSHCHIWLSWTLLITR